VLFIECVKNKYIVLHPDYSTIKHILYVAKHNKLVLK